MVKENSSSSESLPKEERFVINMSSELIAYLCNDYSYRNPNRFSRLKALQDLLIRFQRLSSLPRTWMSTSRNW